MNYWISFCEGWLKELEACMEQTTCYVKKVIFLGSFRKYIYFLLWWFDFWDLFFLWLVLSSWEYHRFVRYIPRFLAFCGQIHLKYYNSLWKLLTFFLLGYIIYGFLLKTLEFLILVCYWIEGKRTGWFLKIALNYSELLWSEQKEI